MIDENINDLFEKRWVVYLKTGNKLPNDAWVKELARDFFAIGFSHGKKSEEDENERLRLLIQKLTGKQDFTIAVG